jgi:hypothetical protein
VYLTASGYNATAIGLSASTNGKDGAFVYGDRSSGGAVVQAEAANEFVVRAAGGFRFRTSANLSTGCNLAAGSGTWSCTSSRAAKHRFERVNGEGLLTSLRAVPVNYWSYISEPGEVRHIGPFAEDFRDAFALGDSETAIGLQDIDGVNFAAIKALEERTRALREENAALHSKLAALEAAVAALQTAAGTGEKR